MKEIKELIEEIREDITRGTQDSRISGATGEYIIGKLTAIESKLKGERLVSEELLEKCDSEMKKTNTDTCRRL